MPKKRIFLANYAEERVFIESSGRYEVTKTRKAVSPDEDGDTFLYFEPIARKRRRIQRVRPMRGVTGRAEYSSSRKVVRRIYDLKTPASSKPPKQIAREWLKRFAKRLGIDKNLSGLISNEPPKTSIFGKHVLYQQYVGKTPISGAWIRVDIDHDGRVFNIQNDVVPQRVLDGHGRASRTRSRLKIDDLKLLSAREAVRRARKQIPVTRGGKVSVSPKSELVYFPSGGKPLLSWKVVIRCTKPKAVYRAYIDAFSGAFLWLQNMIKEATGRARVFDPHPMAMLNRTDLTVRSHVPDEAYREVELRGLKGTGYLDGEFVSTRLTKRRVRRPSRRFEFRRRTTGFAEAMVYFHIDRVQRHLQALGFVNLLDTAILVNASVNRDDQSYYLFDDKSLSFGRGGVDDAEDAEVILHEYGHAIQDAQVPGWGESMESGAMGEGFGDFLAASFFADWKPAPFRTLFGSWDGSVLGNEPPAIRRLDTNRRYPTDIVGEVHDDGEIWSACLWELRDAVGRAAAEKLVIAHHYLLNRWAGFEEAVEALLTADRQLFGGRYKELITDVFVRRGFLLPR